MHISGNRATLTEKEKAEVGTKCANCLSEKELEYHHIVPIALGGSNLITNFVCLCSKCHETIHTGIPGISYSNLVKNGMDKSEVKIGRPQTTIKDLNPDLIIDIKEKRLNITDIGRKYN